MNFELNGDIAILTMDDGKANVVNPAFTAAANAALDRAEQEAKAIVITGRDGMFSAGFDLKGFQGSVDDMVTQVRGGFELLVRLFKFPQPVIAACSGHAFGIGAFYLLVADNRIGVTGNYAVNLPETKISMEVPPPLMALACSRLSPLHLTRAVLQSEKYTHEAAIAAGFIDDIVAPDELLPRALTLANQLAELPAAQYAKNKLDLRKPSIGEMEAYLAEHMR